MAIAEKLRRSQRDTPPLRVTGRWLTHSHACPRKSWHSPRGRQVGDSLAQCMHACMVATPCDSPTHTSRGTAPSRPDGAFSPSCVARARTKRRSCVSRTCRQLLGLPQCSGRRLKAHKRTRTARDGSISGLAWDRALPCELTDLHPRNTALEALAECIQCQSMASLRRHGRWREPLVRRPVPIG